MTKPRVTPVREDDSPLVSVLQAHIETLKAENEILRRRADAAEARTAQETAKAERAIAELSALTRIRAQAAALEEMVGPRDDCALGKAAPRFTGAQPAAAPSAHSALLISNPRRHVKLEAVAQARRP